MSRLSPETDTCIGTLTPEGNSSIHPVVSAVAVSVYFVAEVSFPSVGIAATAHLPAKSARLSDGAAGAGAGAGVAAAAALSFAACSFLPHAMKKSEAPQTSTRRRETYMLAPRPKVGRQMRLSSRYGPLGRCQAIARRIPRPTAPPIA